MIDPVIGAEPTEENVARFVAGVDASVANITAVLKSKKSDDEKRIEVIKNLRFLDIATSSKNITEAIADTAAVQTKREEARQFLISLQKPTPVISPLETHLEELGL